MPRHQKSELALIALPVVLAVLALGGLRWASTRKRPAPVVSKTVPSVGKARPIGKTVKQVGAAWQDIDFTRDGRYFLTASTQESEEILPDGSRKSETVVRLWDAQSWLLLNTLARPDEEWSNFVLTRDSAQIGIAGWKDKRLRLFDLTTGAALGTVPFAPNSEFYELYDDGTRLYESGDGWVRESSTKPHRKLREWPVPGQDMSAFERRSDGGIWAVSNLLPGKRAGTVALWNLPFKGRNRRVLTIPFPGLNSAKNRLWRCDLSLSPDEKTLALAVCQDKAPDNGFVLLFDVQKPRLKHTLKIAKAGNLGELEWSRDGRFLAVPVENKGAFVWDLRAGQPRQTVFKFPNGQTNTLAFTPDQKSIVIGGNDWQQLQWRKLPR